MHIKKCYAISRTSVGPGGQCDKRGNPANELSTVKRLGEPAEPLSHENDASINTTQRERAFFTSNGWLSTSTGSSISMRALQQEEEL